MSEKTELVLNTGQIIDQGNGSHTVVLNRLNCWHTNGGKKRYYDSEEFKKVLPEFKNTPHIFANIHPLNIGKIPLNDALNEVDGHIVGTPQDVLVTNANVFVEHLDVTDPADDELMRNGDVQVSTAFLASVDENGKYYNIQPNHVLFYPISTGIAPGDPCSLILNQDLSENQDQPNGSAQSQGQSSDVMTTEEKNGEPELYRELAKNQQDIIGLQATLTENQNKLAEQEELITNQKSQISERDRTITAKDELLSKNKELITNQATEINSLKENVATLTKQIDDINLAAKNARRERIFNQYLPGTQKEFAARKEEIYDDGKYEDLIFAMNQYQMGIKQPPTTPSGAEDVKNQKEMVSSGVSVVKDPATGKLVSKVIMREA